MIKGLTRAGLGQPPPLPAFVSLASRYGFGAVDAVGSELEEWIDAAGSEVVLQELQNQGVIIGAIGLSPEWRQTEDVFRAGLSRLAKDAEAAAKLGVTSCCTYVLPSTDYPAARFMAVATRRMRTCAEILGAYGIRLGLEFVGPHHLRTRWKHPFIWTAGETLEWIDAIGCSNVGLLYDAYHWYTTGGTLEDIRKLRADQIVHVHINDAKDVPLPEVLDNDRVYPGEGVIDLAAFLQGLQEIGYTGVVAQEVLTAQPSAEPVEELLVRSREGFGKVWGRS
ncbi:MULTISPECIES: sugar phosphate isomerase/epimerase family protein [Paenibacillus]|uniref:sugar phosphate isomerase/epimerase family protein n=1 Tax=Paenibacillus TaxID=44249 RepID=UPI0022B85B18|nr:sugar phosphate isomerase/epimerase family protein [Paenibacillus caseinilyticus]MCZ8522360.1 sugar phosphate isomerase/epimerase [Paenibacillus caseinilyticus]